MFYSRTLSVILLLCSCLAHAEHDHKGTPGQEKAATDEDIAMQREALAKNTEGQGFGPQSPRDIDTGMGNNKRFFSAAPPFEQMNLCNIHFHKNAEHKGGEFTVYAGNGDGEGNESGYRYSGKLKKSQLQKTAAEICPSEHGSLSPGDTIEVHYVYSTAKVAPGQSLNACLNEAIGNPQLRVEAQVFVLANDKNALDFLKLAELSTQGVYHQAPNIPAGSRVEYAGSTTGPGYNQKGSSFEVSWGVREKVLELNIDSLGQWCKGNVFNEDHAHGVRNLVINPALLSEIR